MQCVIQRAKKDKNNPFVLSTVSLVNDLSVSSDLRLFLIYITSKPDSWKFHITEIAKYLCKSVRKIYRIIQEGIKAGYIIREQLKDKFKRFKAVVYQVFEMPKRLKNMFPVAKSRKAENGTLSNTESITPETCLPLPLEEKKNTDHDRGDVQKCQKPETKTETPTKTKNDVDSLSASKKQKTAIEKQFCKGSTELEALAWLKSLSLDSSHGNLSWWAKTYSLERLQDVYKEACFRKPRSVAKYMQTLLRNEQLVPNANAKINKAYANKFKQENYWDSLHVGHMYASFPYGYDVVDISLLQNEDNFKYQLQSKFEIIKLRKNNEQK